MSASTEIRFKIGGDTSALSRAFVQAESVAAAAGKQLHKKFGLQDTLKAGVIALGLNIEKVVEKIAELSTGGSQEAWKESLDAAKDAARIIEEATMRRMSTARQIAALEKDIARNAADENAAPKTVTEQMPGRFAPMTPQSPATFIPGQTVTRATETEAQASARAAKANRDRVEKEAKIAELKERQKRNDEAIADARKELNAAGLEGQEKINSLLAQGEEAGKRLEEARRKGAETAPLELDFLRKQKAAREAIAAGVKTMEENDRKALEEQKRMAEDRVRSAERLVDMQERIQAIEAETATLGETTGEKIERLRQESYDLLIKASDLNRSEDERAKLRIDAAEKRADAAKTEYEWKNKTAKIEDSLGNGKNGKNTTAQGVLANRAARAAAAARAARARGNFGEAARQDEIARTATERFEKNDREGIKGALAPAPVDPRFGGIAARNNAIDAGLAARNAALTRRRNVAAVDAKKDEKPTGTTPELQILKDSRDHLKNIDDALKKKEVK